MPPFLNLPKSIQNRLHSWGTAAGLSVAALSNVRCGGEDPIARTDIDPAPLPPDTKKDPPGTVYDCVDAENAFLLLFKGYGIQHPVRKLDAGGNATNELTMSPPKDGCFVMSLDRLGAAEGQKTEAGIDYWSDLLSANQPNPFPKFDDSNYLDAVTLWQGRTFGHEINSLYRGFPNSQNDIDKQLRKQGSWGEILSLAGLLTLGENASVEWNVKMRMNPDTCQIDLEPWQSIGTEDEGKLFFESYRPEACSGVENINPADIQTVTVCDNATSQPCKTLGMTALSKLEAILIALPLGKNAEDGEVKKVISGALMNFGDGMGVVLDVSGERLKILYQLAKK